MKRSFLFILVFIGCRYLYSQPVPKESFYKKSTKILYDSGENWSSLSCLSSVRFQHLNLTELNPDTLYAKLKMGVQNNKTNIELYGFSYFRYKKYYYGYSYPRVITNTSKFDHYLGKKVGIERVGFNFGKTDLSGIGYENNWIRMQICRGRENWGAGNDIELALGDNSNPYDYLLFGSDYGRIRVNYIHGFLETVSNQINRYVTARGIEWTNNKSLLIGLSETVIYSGENRSLDIGYINPISTHLEIELNNRLNIKGNQYSNAVWQAHIDLMLFKNIRLSANYLFDEFVIDPEIEKDKEHGNAYSLRAAYTLINKLEHVLSINSALIKIGTPTFRHSNGFNNFVNHDEPLGWIGGSDGIEWRFNLNYFNRKNIISTFMISSLFQGEENIISRPYDPYFDYLKGDFPSGNATKTNSIMISVDWWWKPNISFTVISNLKKYDEENPEIDFRLNINVSLETLIDL